MRLPACFCTSLPTGLSAPLVTLACLAGLAGAALARAPQPAPTLREQEIAQCQPQEIATWPDGRDRPMAGAGLTLAYRHEGAPPWFKPVQVLAVVSRAAEAWSACGVPVQVQALAPAEAPPEGAVLVLWSDAASGGHFGLANLRARTLGLGAGAFRLLDARNPAHPAIDTLQMVTAHEMGHFFGLMAHSRRCVDVMSYYDNGQGEHCFTRAGRMPKGGGDYRALLPTACDIARCRALNGTAGAQLSQTR